MVTIARSDFLLWTRISASFLAGLTLVRLFILFHDQQHGTIFRRSAIGSWVMQAIGLLMLNPPSVWKASHDQHHRHNSGEFTPNVGSFPLMTIEDYAKSTRLIRFSYWISRHPLTIALGYITVFMIWMCGSRLLVNPLRHFDAAVSLVLHFGLAWWMFNDVSSLFLGWIFPFFIASGLGTYLFFVQHNFPGVQLQVGDQWNYVFSALHSSSYLRMGRVMNWFTGNIGYHHVHHLNAKIPFYRLPEAMAGIEELQCPRTTTLALSDVIACLRLKLWDPINQKLVFWPKPLASTALDRG